MTALLQQPSATPSAAGPPIEDASSDRPRPPARARMAGAAALATATSSMALSPLFDNGTWFWPAMAAVVAVATAGMTARVLRAPSLLVVLAQAATLLAVVANQVARDESYLGVVPGPDAFARMGEALAAALEEVAVVSAPGPHHAAAGRPERRRRRGDRARGRRAWP